MDKILKALKIQSNCFHSIGQLIRIHAEITSGYYKTRKIFRGDHVELTDEEKLEHEMITMASHCRYLYDCSEGVKRIGYENNNEEDSRR